MFAGGGLTPNQITYYKKSMCPLSDAGQGQPTCTFQRYNNNLKTYYGASLRLAPIPLRHKDMDNEVL